MANDQSIQTTRRTAKLVATRFNGRVDGPGWERSGSTTRSTTLSTVTT
jgi:hypothetical protein